MKYNRIFESYLNEGKELVNLGKEAKKIKTSLIKKWKSKGGYENFGQKEIKKLEDKYIDISDYSADMKVIRQTIQALDDWAMQYDG